MLWNTQKTRYIAGHGGEVWAVLTVSKTLPWCRMRPIACEITGNSTVCSTACSANNTENMHIPDPWSFLMGIKGVHRHVDSFTKVQ